jgi:hypothetical protein
MFRAFVDVYAESFEVLSDAAEGPDGIVYMMPLHKADGYQPHESQEAHRRPGPPLWFGILARLSVRWRVTYKQLIANSIAGSAITGGAHQHTSRRQSPAEAGGLPEAPQDGGDLKLGNVAPVIAASIDHKTYQSPPADGLRAELNSTNPCQACHRGLEVSDKPERSALPG